MPQEEQNAGGEISERLAVAMGFAAQAGEVDPKAIVPAFYGEGAGFSLEMARACEDFPVGVPEVTAEGGMRGVRKLRIQAPGALGATIPQRPAADFLGTTINSPPEPAGVLFLATQFQSSSASTQVTSSGRTFWSTLPATASSTQVHHGHMAAPQQPLNGAPSEALQRVIT